MEEIYGRIAGSHSAQTTDPAGVTLRASACSSAQRCAHFDGFTAVYCGHPHWSDSHLQAQSRELGFARVLIEVFQERGRQVLNALQGDFAIALAHSHGVPGLLAIDRMGICGLNYTIAGQSLHFATVPSRLFSSGEVPQEIDPQALFNYIYFHVIPSPRSIYRNIRKLEPGQCILLDGGEPRVDTYWRPTFALPTAKADRKDLMHEVRERIEQAVRRCDDGEQTGAFLSGGLDSSTVSGMLRRVRGAPVATFSIGFQEDGYDELPFARIAARHFDATPNEHYVSIEDIEQAVPLLASHFDEPFGNSSAIPAYICARFARDRGMRSLLAGDGGDELFAGNARYAKQALFELYGRLPQIARAGLLEPWLVERGQAQTLWPLRKLQRYVEQARTALPDRLESHNLLNTTSPAHVFDPGLLAEMDIAEPLHELARRYHSAEAESPLDRMLFLDWKITLADNDLRKVNAACAVAGVDVRYPMLDDAVVAASMRIPAAEKLKRFKLRAFYKAAFKDFLPREIINKPKHGFGLPFGQWLRASPRLREMVDDALADLQKRGLFADAFIEQVRTSHRDEHAAYYGTMVWVLFMLEQWWQRHI